MYKWLESSLVTDVEKFRSMAYAPATQRTYKTQRDSYLAFCSAMGYTAVPATSSTLCQYAALLARTHKFSSIKQYLHIVRILHLEWDLPNPLQSNFPLQTVLRGIRRDIGDSVTRKTPITPNLLCFILKSLDLSSLVDSTTWAAALIMFFGMLRRSNVICSSLSSFDPSKHLRRKDITFTTDFMTVSIRWSKTIQFKDRILKLPLPRIQEHVLCPVQATFKAFSMTPNAPPDGPAFVISQSAQPVPLTVKIFIETVRRALVSSGFDGKQFAGHSFRRGGASHAYQCGISTETIKNIGDWRSNAYENYVFDSTDSLKVAMLNISKSIKSCIELS